MPLSTFMRKGLTTLLKVVKITSPEGFVQLISTLAEHFTLSAYEIAKAYQESYESALTAINLGLGHPSFFHAQVMNEFAQDIGPNYLQPFVKNQKINDPVRVQEFRTQAIRQYQTLIKYKQNLFQASPSLLTETDFVALVTDNDSLYITELVLEELQGFVHVDELFIAFLRYRDLLGTAMVFFLYEQLRQEPRAERTFAALQRQGLWQNIHDLKNTLQYLMSQLGLSEQVKGYHEVTLHTSEQLQTIENVVDKLQQLPCNTPHYSQLAMWGGRLLSSRNAYPQAACFFEEAKKNTQENDDQALAEFNLFQVKLRHRAFHQALIHLQEAIRLDPQHYALHDIEKYPILKLLGTGGTGCVFLCQHKLQKKSVVVKCFWESRKGPIETVFKEAFAMSHLAGPYVPTPLDYGYADPINQERAFFVTEYVEGAIDGESWLEQEGKLDLTSGLQVGLQVAKGLQVAHRAGFLHLDLKPANLLISKTSFGVNAKIIDFGLSQLTTSVQYTHHTPLPQVGQTVFGTLHYAPPEQQGVEKYGRPSVKSDVFAWGATLYRLLTHDLPYKLNPKRLKESPQLFDLLCECVEEDPVQRPSLERVMSQLEKLLIPSGVENQPDEELERLLEMARVKYGQRSYSSYLPSNNEGADNQPSNDVYVVCPKCDYIFTIFEEGEAMCPQCHGEFEVDQEGFVIASYDNDDEYEEEDEEEYYEDEYYEEEEEEEEEDEDEEYDDSSYYDEDEEEYEEEEEYDEEEYYEEEYDEEDENYEEDDNK